MKRFVLAGCAALLAVAAALLVVATSVASTPPQSLTGEFLGAGSTSGDGGTFVTSATCSQTSPSTISFTASGTAFGPYPGPFTESGFVTISTTPSGQYVDANPLYVVTSVDTFFTIASTAGDVTGVKHLSESGVQGLCDTYVNQPFGTSGSTVTGFFRELLPAADGYGESYDAIITTSSGTFEDTGIAGLLFGDLNVVVSSGNPVENSNAFNEAFSSINVTPVSTAGHATGGGQISPNGNPVAFGFDAKSENGQLKGQCDAVDKAAGVKIHCTDVTAFVQVSPTAVKFFGDASINGSNTTYEIDAQDLADSGAGSDTFSISTASGYNASGSLTAGNVKVHTH